MPTTGDDRALLLLAGVLIVGGLALIGVGLILDPSLALLRRLTHL